MRFLFVAVLVFNLAGVAFAETAFKATDARVELTVSGTRFKVGQPIPYEVKVTNVSKAALPYYYFQVSPRIEPGHSLEVLDKSGKALPYMRYTGMIGMKSSYAELEPGRSLTLKSYINQWVVLDKPGAYTVTASWTKTPRATSPRVTIDIAAPTQQEKDETLAKARKQLASFMTPEEKADAVWILAYTLDSRAIPDIVSAGQDDMVSQEAERALLRFSDQNAVRDALLTQLRDVGPTEPLAYALSNFEAPASKTLPLLKSWLEKGATDQRASALRALSMIQERYKDPSLRALILEQLKDPDRRVRHNAVLALGNGRFGNTLDAVIEVAKNDLDAGVREQATIALGWHKSDKAIPTLKQIAKEPSKQMVHAAVEGLELIDSPASVAALQDYAKNSEGDLKTESQQALDRIAKRKAAGGGGK